jgi:CRP-like cAMP-binding protein
MLGHAFSPATVLTATLQRLVDAARRVSFQAGSFDEQASSGPEQSWWMVAQGRMGLGSRAAKGSFLERHSVGAGEWLDTAGALSGPGTWLERAWCHTPVVLLAVPVAALNEACTRDPGFPQAYVSVLARRVRALNDSLDDQVGTDATGRLARWLLRQPPATRAAGREVVAMTERKGVLARHLGMSSECLSRALRRLCDQGSVDVKGYEITLLDGDGLRRQAFPAPGERTLRRKAVA